MESTKRSEQGHGEGTCAAVCTGTQRLCVGCGRSNVLLPSEWKHRGERDPGFGRGVD